ncbi:hypothetical protein CDEST_01502 [Colletotrichum destructivum]|uniref:Uncharacterized protein n=1 Tax=Colletotrichum destructivum TaxID=34406 RepID=A0AAX4HZ79_9PEZI|nr:hypothetical protein CDEST_01502 [Colletotrichum destructivum]
MMTSFMLNSLTQPSHLVILHAMGKYTEKRFLCQTSSTFALRLKLQVVQALLKKSTISEVQRRTVRLQLVLSEPL